VTVFPDGFVWVECDECGREYGAAAWEASRVCAECAAKVDAASRPESCALCGFPIEPGEEVLTHQSNGIVEHVQCCEEDE
jgi:hypothetical protein